MPTFNTNLNALQAQQALSVNQRSLTESMSKLSTGLRVNSADDDSAGMAIGNQMSAQIISLNQAIRNANDGISMMQTADGASSEMSDMLGRMRQLALQSSSDTYGDSDRDALQVEFAELQAGLEAIVNNTSWNGQMVLDGATVTYHVGSKSDDSFDVIFQSLSGLSALSAAIDTPGDATSALADIDDALDTIGSARASWGAAMNRLTHAANNSANVSMNLSASRSQLLDADYAKATADLARAQIIQQAGTAMLSQANQQPVMVLHLLT
jgi:flagellin